MKKVIILTIALMMIASTGFAAQVEGSGTLGIGGGADATNTSDVLNIGLSNEVTAVYENGGDTSPQWYAIAAGHLGGTRVFGTAQDITNIWFLDKNPSDPPDFSNIPADNTASSTWSGEWEQL